MPSDRRTLGVSQYDLRTVRVELGGNRFLLRYGFSFDGHDRLPESVAVSGNEVTAFFLSATVRDRIVATAAGFDVVRRWTVLQSGPARLVMCIDLPETVDAPRRKGGRPPPPRSFRYLFPGVAGDARIPDQPSLYRGERTAIPACVALVAADIGVCAAADLAPDGHGPSVGVERAADDSGGLARIRFETPGRELEPGRTGPRRQDHDPGNGTEPELVCSGRLEAELTVHVVAAPPETVYAVALRETLGRAAPRPESRKWVVREEVRSLFSTHLVEERGVCGLRVVPGSDVLSAGAGVELAVLLLRLFPDDAEMAERALRLAEFSLCGQHPSGLFYERYSLRERSWVGLRGVVPGRGPRPPLLTVEESSGIAGSFFDLADSLEARGAGEGRFRLAAGRMVEAFFDSRGKLLAPAAVLTPDRSASAEEGIGALRFLHPLLRVVDRDRRERYRKAAVQLVDRWLGEAAEPLDLAASRAGRDPDSRAALLIMEATLEATARKMKTPPCAETAARLLPWLFLCDHERRGPCLGAGALADSFARPRWKPRPAQLTYLCRRFAAMAKGDAARLLEEVAASAARQAGAVPLGCSFVSRVFWEGLPEDEGRDRWRPRARRAVPNGIVVGPVDARDFVTELGYCIRLEEEKLW